MATCCLATYLEKTAFSNDELRTYLSKARTATRIEVDINAYIQDLRESICVLILDGLTHVANTRYAAESYVAHLPSSQFRTRGSAIPHDDAATKRVRAVLSPTDPLWDV